MRTVVMTGGTSGLGAVTAAELAREADTRLILGSRGCVPPLDLTRLASVRTFAAEVLSRVDRIDALVLNAGVLSADADGRTADGYETTFAVNHLSHYLLLRLLLDRLADGARVVLTTSGTHDPAQKASLPTPRHADARLLAHPDQDPDRDANAGVAARRAYTASKLCAVLTARALLAQPGAAERGLSAVAYCPGQVPGTGLVQRQSLSLRVAWRVLGTPLGAPVRRLAADMNTRTASGHGLAAVALGEVSPPPGQVYVAIRRGRPTFPEPSELARRDDLAATLWADSAALVGL